jgi:hypothetical protein
MRYDGICDNVKDKRQIAIQLKTLTRIHLDASNDMFSYDNGQELTDTCLVKWLRVFDFRTFFNLTIEELT